jgi:uncharacterized protein YxjI
VSDGKKSKTNTQKLCPITKNLVFFNIRRNLEVTNEKQEINGEDMRLKQLFVLGEEQREGSRWELGSHRRAHL